MTSYIMRNAFSEDDAREMSDAADLDEAIRQTWMLLAMDMRDNLPLGVDDSDLVLTSYSIAEGMIDVLFDAPPGLDVDESLEGYDIHLIEN